ncbi:SH3 domain-containing protein [Methylocystis heyeri]|uniref:SH3 domain-containing protein n=1 Tax=Methylocystis heyeri TaxID=391905 RepID=A0A6B8KH20_9HYPH|nr:hypothetical protein [Methylocystis heyeri]QGM45858.1 hypothetical protein H2LOC_009165 [Methylocystis heyeri]
MSSKMLSILAGIAFVASATSAFAFDAQVTRATPLRTHASPHAGVIEVVPANSIIDMQRCARGWCEASYDGRMGYVYTPVLMNGEPSTPGPTPFEVITAPVTVPVTVVGAAVGAAANVIAPPAHSY